MAELTPEERRRIYEEEKARLEIRTELEQGHKKPMSIGRAIAMTLLIILCIVMGLGVIAAILEPSTSTYRSSIPALATKPDLEVIGARGDGNKIHGTLRNNTSKTYGYVQIQFNIYDGSGNQVGSTLANVNNLEPLGTWRFEAYVLQDNFSSFKVSGISGF